MTYHLRRSDLEITDPGRIDEILSEGRFVTIALVDDGAPYLVTLSYGYDPEHRRLCCHVARAGRKLDIIAIEPRACATVVIDHGYRFGDCEHPYTSVVMEGTLRIAGDAEVRDAMRTLLGHLEGEEGSSAIWSEHRFDDDDSFDRMHMLIFDITAVSAKSGK